MAEVQKTQQIRLLDVFLLGPFMAWSAQHLPHPTARAVMFAAGFTTMGYNFRNYMRVRKRRKK